MATHGKFIGKTNKLGAGIQFLYNKYEYEALAGKIPCEERGAVIVGRGKQGRSAMILFGLILPLLAAVTAVCAQVPEPVDADLIDRYVQKEMRAGNIPGLAVGIVIGDRVVYLKGFGTAGPGKGAVTPQTAFVLGSVSKSLTGLAVMQLVERGLINLDDPVKKILPWFSMGGPQASDDMKIVHLLNHTSGIPAAAGHDSGIERGASIEERVRLKNSIRLNRAPGNNFEYSSLNYDILGVLIEKVTGVSYQEYIQFNIFQPLEMTHSYTSLAEASEAGLATGYRPWFGFLEPAAVHYPESALPSGYLASSAEDMTHVLLAFLNQGTYKRNTVLSAKGIADAQTSIGSTGYAAGWFSAGYYKWHTGELANYNAYICTVPSEKIGIIALGNTNDIGIKFLNQGSSSLRRIPEGIRVLLVGGQLPEDPLLNVITMYVIVDLVVALLFAILTGLLIRACRTGMRSQVSRSRIFSWTLVTLAVPAAILFLVPVWIQGSWLALLISVPDLTVSALVLSALMLAQGVAGIVFLVRRYKKANRKEVSCT
jgi:CubicO group peptidase (beta-lactamase class C family)